MMQRSTLAVGLCIILLGNTTCDSNRETSLCYQEATRLSQDRTLLVGRWLLRTSCGELGCSAYGPADSPREIVFKTDSTAVFYNNGVQSHEKSYRIIEEVFLGHQLGLTSGLKFGTGAETEFGVNERYLTLSTAYLDGPSECYERLER